MKLYRSLHCFSVDSSLSSASRQKLPPLPLPIPSDQFKTAFSSLFLPPLPLPPLSFLSSSPSSGPSSSSFPSSLLPSFLFLFLFVASRNPRFPLQLSQGPFWKRSQEPILVLCFEYESEVIWSSHPNEFEIIIVTCAIKEEHKRDS